MSNLTAVVNNIISKVNTHTTDLSNKTTQIATHISGIAAYHLLQGNLAVSNYTTTQGFNTTLYTSGSATTGIDMNTQWGNTGEERFGGLIWLKDRAEATNNFLYDTIRGVTKEINSNATDVEATLTGGLTAFNATGFTVGADTGHNSTTNNMVSWNFQTTHRVTGTTNHGKAYTCHYNPFTGFTIVKYEGSGIAGHEIPHHLGRKLKFATFKNLTASSNWYATDGDKLGYLNLADAFISSPTDMQDNKVVIPNSVAIWNGSTNQHIMYGWANSYFDKSNKLIGNYEIGIYQGTGVAGNKIQTRGKPAWVMTRRIDAVDTWYISDNQRGSGDYLLTANTSNAELTGTDYFTFATDGFLLNQNITGLNASGGQYLYMVAYDTNSNGGGTYYPLASDTANLQVNNALIPIAQGIDSNGVKNIILSKNETISGLTLTDGKNYPYYDALGNIGVSVHKPRYLKSELVRTKAGENPDYFDIAKNKWFTTTGGSELVTNGTFDSNTTGWTAYLGATLTYVNGVMRVTRSTDGYSGAQQTIQTEVGKKYKLVANVTKGNDNWSQIGVFSGVPSSSNVLGSIRSGSNNYVYFIAQSSTTILSTQSDTNGLYADFDNISVFEVEPTIGTEITNGRNYLNHIVYADNDGGLLYVEELPKTQYVDTLKVDGFDLGQTWQDVTASRAAGVTYTNTTGKPITISVVVRPSGTTYWDSTVVVQGKLSGNINRADGTDTNRRGSFTVIVPDGNTYIISISNSAIAYWLELR